MVSDHLCWTGVHGVNLHDLLPFPYTREALDHVVSRVDYVQDFLNAACARKCLDLRAVRPSEMTEWEFIAELTSRPAAGCCLT